MKVSKAFTVAYVDVDTLAHQIADGVYVVPLTEMEK